MCNLELHLIGGNSCSRLPTLTSLCSTGVDSSGELFGEVLGLSHLVRLETLNVRRKRDASGGVLLRFV